MEKLKLAEQIKGKRHRGNQSVTYLMRLGKWTVGQSLGKIAKKNVLKTKRDRTMWRAYVVKRHGT